MRSNFGVPSAVPKEKTSHSEFSAPLTCFGAENLLNGYFRPYIQPNGWIPAPDDETPSIRIDFGEEREIKQIRLFFDTDFDHALENVQMEHFDSVMPQCILQIPHYRQQRKPPVPHGRKPPELQYDRIGHSAQAAFNPLLAGRFRTRKTQGPDGYPCRINCTTSNQKPTP